MQPVNDQQEPRLRPQAGFLFVEVRQHDGAASKAEKRDEAPARFHEDPLFQQVQAIRDAFNQRYQIGIHRIACLIDTAQFTTWMPRDT